MPGLPKPEPASQVGGGDANKSLEAIHDILSDIDSGLKKKLPNLEAKLEPKPTPQVGGGDANELLGAVHDVLLNTHILVGSTHDILLDIDSTLKAGHAFDKKTAADAKIKAEQDELEKKSGVPAQKIDPKETASSLFSNMGILFWPGIVAALSGALLGATAGLVVGYVKMWMDIFKFLGKKLGRGKGLVEVKKIFDSKILDPIKRGIKSVKNTFHRITKPIKQGFTFLRNTVRGIVKPFKVFFTTMKNVFGPLANAVKNLLPRGLVSAGGQVANILRSLKEGLFGLGRLHKIFGHFFLAAKHLFTKWAWPLQVIVSLIDGFFESKDAVGKSKGILASYVNAMFGLLGGIIDGFLFQLADMVKDVVAWIAGFLGFEGVEKFLDSFSFSEIFNKFLDGLYNIVNWIFNDALKLLTKLLPSWLGGTDKSEAELKRQQLAREKEIAEKKEELRQSKLFIETGGKEGKDTVWNRGSDVAAEEAALGSKQANIDKLIAQNEKAKALDIEFKKKATTKSEDSSIFTHDHGIHDRLDRIFPVRKDKNPVWTPSLFTHDHGTHDRLDKIFPAKDKNPVWIPSQRRTEASTSWWKLLFSGVFSAWDNKNPKRTGASSRPEPSSLQRSSDLRSNNVGTGNAPPVIVNNTTQNVSQGDTNSIIFAMRDGGIESFPGGRFGQRIYVA